jgi:hypothetical protein
MDITVAWPIKFLWVLTKSPLKRNPHLVNTMAAFCVEIILHRVSLIKYILALSLIFMYN